MKKRRNDIFVLLVCGLVLIILILLFIPIVTVVFYVDFEINAFNISIVGIFIISISFLIIFIISKVNYLRIKPLDLL